RWNGNESTLRLWDPATGRVLRDLPDRSQVVCLAFHPNGRVLATTGRKEGLIRLWDVDTGRPLRTILHGPRSALIADLAFSPDSTRLYSLNGNGTVSVLRLDAPAP